MRNILFLFILIGSTCSAQQPKLYKSTTTGKVEFTAAEYTQAAVDANNAKADSIAVERKKATFIALQNLYNANVVGVDVRNLSATQQKITLGVILMNLGMVDTSFKMK